MMLGLSWFGFGCYVIGVVVGLQASAEKSIYRAAFYGGLGGVAVWLAEKILL